MYNIINKYIFRSEQVKESISIIEQRLEIFLTEVESKEAKYEFTRLKNDYEKLAVSIIWPKCDEYNSDYFQCCLDAMIEINFRMFSLEKRYLKLKERKKARKLFNYIRDNISTFSGMKTIILIIMLSIIVSITILKVLKYLFGLVIINFGMKNNLFEIVEALFIFILCLFPSAIFYKTLIPALREVLVNNRVQREMQREMLIQILMIFITIFIAVLL